MSTADEQLAVTVTMPVAWGDMDALGHVNNTVYLRWFEDARMAYFRAVGMDELQQSTSVGPILAHTSCSFRIPLEYPDTVSIQTGVVKQGNTSFTMRYLVRSEAHGGKVAAEGEGIIVMMDYGKGEKVPMPATLREQIDALQAARSAPLS